ncbi:MAG TPA: trypsin-like peptidase domain-containing protein, partial [Solirubrobacterales bacterium]|nr:trypsin-like peptidase domain-containing protein [Solirubrobacterales bacterium]
MPEPESKLRSPFFSALLGGAVVAVIGLIAIAAGLVESDGGTTTTVAAPLTAPVDAKGEEESGNVVNQIYRADGEGVAFIESQIEPQESEGVSPFNPFGEPEPEGGGQATGSGFVIDEEGHVLTNNHVIEGAGKVTVKLGDSEKTYDAEVVGTDPGTDIALLKVDAPASEFHPLRLGRSSDLEVGDPVVAIGNPFGLDRTVTSGIVSALQRNIQAPNGFSISHVIQTDAAINPGNSGGPLINAEGAVIGINAQIATGGGSNGNVGIGFAIPIDTVKDVAGQLIKDGKVEHAYLGVDIATISSDLAENFRVPVDKGVLVQHVRDGSPAADAGLKGG